MGAELKRIFDYQSALVDMADQFVGRQFLWGQTDCMTLSINAASKMYDDPSMLDFVTWVDEETARAFFKDETTPDAWLSDIGARQIPFEAICHGDAIVGCLPDLELPFSYFCIGSKLLSSLPDHGVFMSSFRIIQRLPKNSAVYRLP